MNDTEHTRFRQSSLFPRSLAQSVEPLLKPIYKKHGFAEHRILTQWEDIVGKELASGCIPQKLSFRNKSQEHGTLHILVNSGRALELQHMQPRILDKIATYFGYPAVSKITLTQTSLPLYKKPVRKRPKIHPLSADYLEQASAIEDPELRTAFIHLSSTLALEK